MNDLSGIIVDSAYHIHKDLGPGLLEKFYEVVLAKQLKKRVICGAAKTCTD